MKTGLLLIAHGSREPEANADLVHVVQQRCGGLGSYPVVEPAFLELAAPDGDEAGRRCVEQGMQRVVILPYFLSAGVHVRRDLAGLRARLAEQFPGVEFCLAEPLGRHPGLIEVVRERARAAEGPEDAGAVNDPQGSKTRPGA